MRIQIWLLRVVILIYSYYKIFFYNTNGAFRKVVSLEPSWTPEIVGKYTGALFLFFLICAFSYYQIKQGLLEIQNSDKAKRIRFRGLSIVVLAFIFFLSAYSLVNLEFLEVNLKEYLLYPYNLVTFLSILSAIVVIYEDMRLFRNVKKNEIKTPYNIA